MKHAQVVIAVMLFKALLSLAAVRQVNITNSHNPGPCSADNHGYLKIVKDRKMDDKLLVCSEENGVYKWISTDGSDTPGEFFNPGFDCSDILDKKARAENGFYWVKFHGDVPKMVWCDMFTDGGGYMLIGRKTTPKTWSIPSNSTPVHPYGPAHWLSSVSGAPIMDFRIQVSKTENIQKCSSHWAYRLKQKRQLGNLLVEGNKVGCGRKSPGIGDIAYVKDLQIDKIVSTNFRCSKFGGYSPPASKSGWTMMNLCLRQPCPFGFAYHFEHKFQNYYSGSFSYSVSESTSGVSEDSTAFIGCNHGLCCECHGPVGGIDNYCSDDCRAKNGGKVEFGSVYTWYWVRSSLPKKVWNHCMEFKEIGSQGETEWLKLIGYSSTPIKGRCPEKQTLLNNGVVVVPDNKMAKKVPAVDGLLEYRKDNKQLYVRTNETWSVVAQEEKVEQKLKQLDEKLQKVQASLNNLINSLTGSLSNSVILSGEPTSFQDHIKKWLPTRLVRAPICWRATSDGWAVSVFHRNCDYQGPTLTIVKVGNYIFGGYTEASWAGSSDYKKAPGSFMFSLRNSENLPPFKAALKDENTPYAIYVNSGYGPTFGSHDLYISNNAGSNTNSHTYLNNRYQAPSGVSNTNTILAGTNNFSPSEVEVFYLV